MMKKIIALSVAVLSMVTASAQQQVLKKVGGFCAIPGFVTNDGKGRLGAMNIESENPTISIIGRDLKDEASFNVKTGSYTGVSYTEYVDVNILDKVKVTSYNDDINSLYDVESYYGGTVTDGASLAKAMGDSYKAINVEGFDYAAIQNSNNYYYDGNRFGKKFPSGFYAVKNGMVYSVYRYYNLNLSDVEKYAYDIINGKVEGFTFTKDESSVNQDYYSYRALSLRIFSIDNGDANNDVNGTYATQTLLNDDDKWEYLVQGYDAKFPKGSVESAYPSFDIYDINEGVLRIKRYKEEVTGVPNCINIMSQDGECLGKIPFKNTEKDITSFIIDGTLYFVGYEFERIDGNGEDLNGDGIIDDNDNIYEEYACLYRFDGIANGVTLIERTPANDNSVFNIAGQRVGISHKGIVIKNGKKYMK